MRKHIPTVRQLLMLLLACGTAATSRGAPAKPTQQQPTQQQQRVQTSPPHQAAQDVELVIALDTSSSMDGLIDSARQKLWDVVNLLSQARPQPVLKVGLISYGNDGYSSQAGWVRKESDLTTDLDGIYSKLFALRTNGGSEYVARAVHAAVGDMKWSQDPKTLRILFVAGNEPANQDPLLDVSKEVDAARGRGIFVNTIYCGAETAGEASLWRTVALAGKGEFAAIDANRVMAIATPMDDELARLSQQLNSTYVAYGALGAGRAANQMEQDKNAQAMSAPAAASRAVAKSGKLYHNESWDLLDARDAGRDVKSMKAEELPQAMRNMAPAEREAYLDKKAKERSDIQKRIATLSSERQKFIDAERRKKPAGPKDLDDAVSGAIRKEAQAKGFAF